MKRNSAQSSSDVSSFSAAKHSKAPKASRTGNKVTKETKHCGDLKILRRDDYQYEIFSQVVRAREPVSFWRENV